MYCIISCLREPLVAQVQELEQYFPTITLTRANLPTAKARRGAVVTRMRVNSRDRLSPTTVDVWQLTFGLVTMRVRCENDATLPSACCSTHFLFRTLATVGGRLQVGDLSEFVGVRCILTMQPPARWWNARDYVAASPRLSWLRPRFSHKAKATRSSAVARYSSGKCARRMNKARRNVSLSDSDLLQKIDENTETCKSEIKHPRDGPVIVNCAINYTLA